MRMSIQGRFSSMSRPSCMGNPIKVIMLSFRFINRPLDAVTTLIMLRSMFCQN